MVHTLESIANSRFLNLTELQSFVKNDNTAQDYMNDDGTVSSWVIDEFVALARNAGVSRKIPDANPNYVSKVAQLKKD